ncbi:MAG TPA: FAD-dependent oxidoreductase [Solirubrobacteraceae bacterium]|nr:FAD-dependent oxidoreductase [Solirubrobacteraceae bacterium]
MGNDIVIVGAGIVGCTTAYFLASQGVGVTVVDPVGVAAAASGRNNGLIEHPYDVAAVPLFTETVELLREALGDALPDQPAGTLLVAENEPDARRLVEHYTQFPELQPQLLIPAEARLAEPLLGDGIWGCLLHTGYPIRPLEATSAFADLARQAGADFVVGSDFATSRYNTGGITAKRLLERHEDAIVVVAAGAGTPAVLEGYVAADIITPLWGVIVSVELPQQPRHPLIEGVLAVAQGGGALPDEAPFTLLNSPVSRPTDSPSYLAVGSTMLQGSEPDGSAWSPRLLSRGMHFVPSIADARVLGTLVCARPRSFDNRPIMGRVPGEDRLWIASGHGGRGMSLGAASGRLIAGAIIAGSDAAIPYELSATRLSSL